MNNTKHFLKSKTLWFNVLAAIFAVLIEQSDTIKLLLSDDYKTYFTLFLAMGNAILRTITTQGVTIK